jgi:hypothetical protein
VGTISKSKKNTKKSPTRSREKEYYENLDLRTWWETFSTECLGNGVLRYKTIWSFITVKTKIQWQRDFLWWLLGPKGESQDYKDFPQFNWEDRREKGHWYEGDNAKRLAEDISNKRSALDSLKQLGTINLTFISRIEALATEIDREFSGRLFLSDLSLKENSLRVKMYFTYLSQIQGMLNDAQLMYGKSQGLDLERMSDFYALFSKGMSEAAANMGFIDGEVINKPTEANNKASAALSQIMDMVVNKAAKQGIALPDKDMETIIVANAKPVLVKDR